MVGRLLFIRVREMINCTEKKNRIDDDEIYRRKDNTQTKTNQAKKREEREKKNFFSLNGLKKIRIFNVFIVKN